MNKFLRAIIVAPTTTTSRKYPTRIKVKDGCKIGLVVIEQIHTIDKQRLIRILGRLSQPEIKSVIKETGLRRRKIFGQHRLLLLWASS